MSILNSRIRAVDILFFVAMTFVIAFPSPSVYKAISIIVFFCYTTLLYISRFGKIGEPLQYVWAISFLCFCYASKWWSIYPEEIEDVINNVCWSLMLSISVVNYVRVCDMSVIGVAKRISVLGIIFLIDVILNGVYVNGRYTVSIGGYELNANTFGQISLGIAYYLLYWSKKIHFKNIILNAYTVLMIVLALMSGSRKIVVTLAIYVVAFTMYEYSSRDIIKSLSKILLAACIAVAGYWCIMRIDVLHSTIGVRVESILDYFRGDAGADGSAYARANMMQYAIRMFKEKPILGYGLNVFQKVAGFDTYAHNNYMELLANIGIVGCIIYYVPILTYLRRAVSLWYEKIDDSIFPLIIILAFLVNDYANVSYFTMTTHFFLGLGIGLLCNKAEERKKSANVNAKTEESINAVN